jgi:ribose 5-phosphate isomerase A
MDLKKLAAEKAVEALEQDMIIGLGTGSTAYWAIQKIGERVKEGLRIKAVATSQQSEDLARELGIPMISFADIEGIDVTIDGADEVDKYRNLIKGGGGALLREKIVAYHTKKYLVIIDESKLVTHLGRYPLPVEVLPFAVDLTLKRLKRFSQNVQLRQRDGNNYITDNGNFIADIHLYPIVDPEHMNDALHQIPGVIETGLFLQKLVTNVIVGRSDGEVEIL